MNYLLALFIFTIGCGSTVAAEITVVEKILDGDEVEIKDLAYQAAIEFQGSFLCGASILNETTVLTAAHCFREINPSCDNKLEVRIKSQFRERGGTSIAVQEIFIHPDYDGDVDYDVAILVLENGISFDKKSKPIKLADKEPPVGDDVQASGWGRTDPLACLPAVKLQAVKLPVMDRQTCVENLQTARLRVMDRQSAISLLTDRMFCGDATEGGVCVGDSGGPIIFNETQVGIVSWTKLLCKSPNVFVNVVNPEIRGFIRNITGL